MNAQRAAKVRRAPSPYRGFVCGNAVAYFVDRRNGWAVYLRDAEGAQVGDAEYHYRKRDAMRALERIGAGSVYYPPAPSPRQE